MRKVIFIAMLWVISCANADEMDKLKALEGSWMMSVSYTSDAGNTWQDTPPGEVRVMLGHKNKLLREVPVTILDEGFNMETYLSWDQYRGVFRKAAIDDVWGIMDIYEGNIEDNKLIMTNLRSGTSFPIEDNKSRFFRLTIELAEDERMMIVDASDDKGRHWVPAFKVIYKKLHIN